MYYPDTVELGIAAHKGKELTGYEMGEMVKSFSSDLGRYAQWPFNDFFDFVRLIPYISDDDRFPSRVLELVPRPLYLLDRFLFPAIDCKKKAVLIASWARENGFPWRFIAASARPDGAIHHVFPQIDFGYGWVTVDATFPDFRIGQGHEITFGAELNT